MLKPVVIPVRGLAFSAATALLFGLYPTPLHARLPEEGLKRALQAEKQLAAGKTREAIASLAKLEAEFPEEGALSLRLAQIYDTMSESGATLFYYRRYVKLVGESAREDAQARLSALELEPGASEAAKKFAKKLGKETAPVPPPTPKIERSLAAEAPDGSLKPLKGPKDVEKLAAEVSAKGTPLSFKDEEPPTTTPRVFTPVPLQRPLHPAPSQALQKAMLPATPVATPQPTQTKKAVAAAPKNQFKISTSATPTPSPTPAKGMFTPPALSRKLEAQLAESSANPARPRSTSAPAAPEAGKSPATATLHSSLGPSAIRIEIAPPTPSPATPPEPSPTPAEEPVQPAPGDPILQSTPSALQEGNDFFTTAEIGGEVAVIRLENKLPDSYMTFTASGPSARPINVILASGESRVIKLPAGRYDVVAHISDTNYPPATLLDTKFSFEFEPGIEYRRSISPKGVSAQE